MRLRSFALAFTVILGLLGAGCPQKDCFVGNPSLPPELVIVHRSVDGKIERTEGDLPMIEPPQGGEVAFVGPRVRNIDGCGVVLTASLRDECNNGIIGLEEKMVTLARTPDGWLEPAHPIDISNFSNLPTCPASAAERRIDGEPYLLKVRTEDQKGRMAEATMRVTPFCAESMIAERCRCRCVAHPELGGVCQPESDSGVAPGTCPIRMDGGVDAGP